MRFSTFRSSVAALAAAVAFAACGGHGLTPSTSIPGGAAPDAIGGMTPLKATGPCGLQQTKGWIFGGSCFSVALKPAGGSGKLAAYKGLTIAAVLKSNNAKAGTIVIFRDATGKGDITPIKPSKAFPLYGKKTCEKVKGASCPGTAFAYIEGVNTGKAFNLNFSPGITVTNTGKYPGKSCGLAELVASGWDLTPLHGTVSGKKLAYPSLPATLAIPSGAFFIVLACS
jgi:hypothetical protein